MEVCMVVGSHPCWEEDYRLAALKYPTHKVCAVNYSTAVIEADYVATVHPEMAFKFMEPCKNNPILYVQDKGQHDGIGLKLPIAVHGGSGTFAAAAMAHIGFDLVIMCGCPIDGDGGYARGTAMNRRQTWKSTNMSRVKYWQTNIPESKKKYPEIFSKVRSMSGYTKDVFGGIDDN